MIDLTSDDNDKELFKGKEPEMIVTRDEATAGRSHILPQDLTLLPSNLHYFFIFLAFLLNTHFFPNFHIVAYHS